jgi:hypothetical protein
MIIMYVLVAELKLSSIYPPRPKAAVSINIYCRLQTFSKIHFYLKHIVYKRFCPATTWLYIPTKNVELQATENSRHLSRQSSRRILDQPAISENHPTKFGNPCSNHTSVVWNSMQSNAEVKLINITNC